MGKGNNPNGRPKNTYEQTFARNVVIGANDDDCHLWIGSVNTAGYGITSQGEKNVTAHRWAYSHAKGVISEGMHVLHTCDVRRCVNPSHLFLGTHADNMHDKAIKGRAARKLTAEQVLAIRSDSRLHTHIAAEYGIHAGTVSEIKRRRIWAHLEGV